VISQIFLPRTQKYYLGLKLDTIDYDKVWWLVSWLAGWLLDWLSCLAGWLSNNLAGCLAGWLSGWLAVWLSGWLSGWLAWPGLAGWLAGTYLKSDFLKTLTVREQDHQSNN
jgi:hypothetical protein